MKIKMTRPCFPDIARLDRGEPADEGQIHAILDYIDQRLDCADFRLVCIVRSLYFYAEHISPATLRRMETTVLGFKYWMDEPGVDSMCYWSENHQLIFATCEYLAGQLFPERVFRNDGSLGRYHVAKARERLDIWLEARFRLGFVEWHSNTYYEEDIAPLSLLIDCCEDPLLAAKARRILDLLLLDMALHHYRGLLASTSGRCYERQKKYPEQQDVTDILERAFAFHPDHAFDYSRLSADFLLNRSYQLPAWILRIAHDAELGLVKSSMGLDLGEVDDCFPLANDVNGRGLYLWSMEAFTNPEACETALKLYREWKLGSNDFLKDLRALDIPLVSRLGLLPLVTRLLNPVTSGIAIQRVNSYSYRSPAYLLSSAQRYHPGTFGDQQHIWQATIGSGVSVFTTHPGAAFFADNARNFSPSYWVGNGVLPDCRQDRNVVLCVYDLSVRRGYMERERLLYTHAWFPQQHFDETRMPHPRCMLGRQGNSYVALLALEALEPADNEELIQRGKVTAWACVTGSAAEHGSFAAFETLCAAARVEREGQTFTLRLADHVYQLVYKGDFTVDGEAREWQFPRLESKFGRVARDPEAYTLQVGGRERLLDWPDRLCDLRSPQLPEADPYRRIVALCDDVVARLDPKMKWTWGQALLGHALTELDRYRGTDQYTPFLTRYCRYWLEHSPKLDYADRIAPALITYAMEKRTGSKAFAPLTQAALHYVRHEPRLLEDAVNHLGRGLESHWYPASIWVDSLMMFSVFPSLYAREQDDPELLDFAARQPAIYARYLQDAGGLWVHSYWAKARRPHPNDGSFWGRGNGWVLTSLPMIMENIGAEHPEYPTIGDIFRKTAAAVLPWQNSDGSFNTIINKKSYRELSATALIAAGLLHGVRLGLLAPNYLGPGLRALEAVSEAIEVSPGGISLPEISAPTIPLQLFPTLCYKLTPRGRNLSYGLAAALFAAVEYKKLQDEEWIL